MAKFGFDTSQIRLSLVTADSIEEHPEIADTPLDFALRYAELGWFVLPVRKDKKPLDGYGLTSATRDVAVIRKIWTAHPQAGIAVACEKSGLVVLDIDPRNGGHDTLTQLEARLGVLYSAVTANTQGGGEHRVFKAEPGVVYPGTLGEGLDIKYKGYILVEPSVGPSGVYRWQEGKNPTEGHIPTGAPSVFGGRSEESKYAIAKAPGSIVVAPQVYEDLKAALKVVSPEEDYNTWYAVLQALRRLSDEDKAYELARDWSTRSTLPGHDLETFEHKWAYDLDEPGSSTYLSIFRMADERDPSRAWRQGIPTVALVSTPEAVHPLALSRAKESGASSVTLFEFLYDDFMSTGVNVIAGAPGVGKTTLVIPMALVAAHLCPHDHPMKPAVRRNVIIITESVVQVQRVIYSLAQWGFTGMGSADFEQRVRVIPAHRLDPAVVAQVAGEYAEWTVDNAMVCGGVFKAKPVVVLDTANAVLELENENDNAEVGRAMALIKQSFGEFPLLIVAHTAKAMGSAESDGLSPRGASAWTGDAHGVYTVFKDGEHPDSPRVLKATKVRFPTRWPELTFDLVSHSERHPNVLGTMGEVHFSHSVARPLKSGERAQFKEDNKDARENDDYNRLCDDLIELVRRDGGRATSYYSKLTANEGGLRGGRDRKERAMLALINDGSLVRVMLEKPVGQRDHYLRVDEAVVSSIENGRFAV